MADSTDALLELFYAMTTTYGARLAPDAIPACRDIFEHTLGRFARRAADLSVPDHPWDHAELRAFLLGQVRRIADEAGRRAGGEPISSAVLVEAAQDVMLRTSEVCRTVAEQGRLKFSVADVATSRDASGAARPTQEGGLCDAYLASVATGGSERLG